MADTITTVWNANVISKEKEHAQRTQLLDRGAEKNYALDGGEDPSLVRLNTPVKCLILATLLSMILTVIQVVCIVLTVQTIQDRDLPVTEEVHQGYRTELPTVPCNKSTPCTLLKDDVYAKLVLLFSGVKRQSLIRNSNMRKHPYMLVENCDQFVLQNCSKDTLKWSDGHQRVTNGSITVKESSLYGLHSIFTFKRNSTSLNTSSEGRSSQIKHSLLIERKSHNESQILFEKYVTLNKENKFKTSSIFDFVHLKAGDRVYPSLSDTSSLYSVQQANGWGIFPIR